MGRIPEGTELIPGQGGGYKSPKIGFLWPQHRHMARLVATGAAPGDIAAATGYSAGQISRILGSPVFQAEVARLVDMVDEEAVASVQDDLKNLSGRAVEVLAEDLELEPRTAAERSTRQRAAFDVLDRAGFGKKENPQIHQHLHAHLHEAQGMKTEDLLQDVLNLAAEEA